MDSSLYDSVEGGIVASCAGRGLAQNSLLVFECSALQDLRVSFAPLFQRAATMQQFMWQPDLMPVAQFQVSEQCRELIQAMDQTSNQPGWLEQM